MTNQIYLVLLTAVLLLSYAVSLSAQQNLLLNGSFEDRARMGNPPSKWLNCKEDNGATPVDVHSGDTKHYGVQHQPSDGKTFVGMVVRDNDTREGISQQLQFNLIEDHNYLLTFDVSQSDTYISQSAAQLDSVVNFIDPTCISIILSDLICNSAGYLLDSEAIVVDKTSWETIVFDFVAPSDVDVITFYAYHCESRGEAYNGHVLLDNAVLIDLNEN